MPNARSYVGLQRDVLCRTLQKRAYAGIKIVLPWQQTLAAEVKLVARGRRLRAATGGQRGIVAGLSGPAFAKIGNISAQVVLRGLVSLGVDDAGVQVAAEALPEVVRSFAHLDDLGARQSDFFLGRLHHLDLYWSFVLRFGRTQGARVHRTVHGLHHEELLAFEVSDFGPLHRRRAQDVVELDVENAIVEAFDLAREAVAVPHDQHIGL